MGADGFTLKALIAWAYRVDENHVDLAADLEGSERYDVRLNLPGAESWPAIDRLVQKGIERHFGISITRDTRPIEVFILTAQGGPGSGLRTHDTQTEFGLSTGYTSFSTASVAMSEQEVAVTDVRSRFHAIDRISMSGTTMVEFGRWLEEFLGLPVIDDTGLTGTYDIEVQGEMQGVEELIQAIRDQLALVLTRAQRDAQMLVVGRAER